MHPRTVELLRHLDDARARLTSARDAVPAERRDRRPPGGAWSIGNVLAHLARTEAQVATLLQRKLRTAMADNALPALADPRPLSAALGDFDGERLLDRAQRVAAPESARPDPTQTANEAWQALQDARQRMRQLLLAADGLDTDTLRAPHPLLGELTFVQWVAFVGYHERRHAAQIDELAAAAD